MNMRMVAALAAAVLILPAPLAHSTDSSTESPPDAQAVEVKPDGHAVEGESAAHTLLAEPDAHAAESRPLGVDQRVTQLDPSHELLAGPAAPTLEHGVTSLPAPQPGAEVYDIPANRVLEVVGGGFGHGIGMSQYGAHGAGLAGLDHREILDFYYPGTDLQNRDNPTLRVGITLDYDAITQVVRRAGLVVSNAPGTQTYSLPGNHSQYRVRATGSSSSSCVLEGRSGSNWTTAWPQGLTRACPITFSSSQGSVDLVLPNGQVGVYRGALTATHRGSAGLLTINHLPMQDYLLSVTAAEMPYTFHQQALRAQAVAARTYALSGSSATSHYDVCDTTWCQAYRGMGLRASDGSLIPYEHANTTQAVQATQGEVLTYVFADGIRRMATAMYSSSTGGHTTHTPGAGHGYLIPQADPYDDVAINPRASWTANLPATALQARYGIHRVERVQILRRDGHGAWGGRIVDARVEGFTAGGVYAWAYATGDGLSLARQWPTYADGLSSNYFTFVGGQEAPGEAERLSGENRYETAAAVSGQWSPGVGVVYIASGEDFPDALTAASRAGVNAAPVLLTRATTLPTATRAALERLRPGRIVVIGGPTSVSAEVVQDIAGYAVSGQVQRVGGQNRYATSAALASYYPAGGSVVYLASGEDFPDALAAAALSGMQNAPLLLARADRLDQETLVQLQRLNAERVVVLGGPEAISAQVAQRAASHTRSGVQERLAGANRWETMALVAERFGGNPQVGHVVSGEDFPDALAGAALAGLRGAPLVLVRQDSIPLAADAVLRGMDLRRVVLIGGSTAVSDGVLEELRTYL